MTAPITMTQPGESLQRVKRGWTDEFTDQHGRKYAAQYELSNSRPIGELSPVGFSPPWTPPMRFIVWERHGGFRFRWDYATMANELAEGSDAFYTEVVQFMMEHMPTEKVPEIGEPIPERVRRLVGKPPLSPAIPLAAEAGDPWILGEPGAVDTLKLRDVLAQTVNANGREAIQLIRDRTRQRLDAAGVAPIVTRPSEPVASDKAKTINSVDLKQLAAVSYQEFIGAAMRGGMTMAEAAVAWKAHRENVALEQSA
jgi:hypothetical protein